MKRIILTTAFALVASTAHAQVVGYGATVAGNVADYVTTRQAIARGAVEANPLHPDKWPVKLTTTGVQLLLVWYLQHSGHPRAANWVGIGFGTQGALLAWHNNGVNR